MKTEIIEPIKSNFKRCETRDSKGGDATTSEVLIMNEMGVALAADSAATAMNKVFKADKIFELSRTQPLGVMIYGLSSIDTVPFELIVSEYRRQNGDKEFATVSECADDFLRFIETGGSESVENNPIITPEYVDEQIRYSFIDVLRKLAKQLEEWRVEDGFTDEQRELYIDRALLILARESGKGIDSNDTKALISSIRESLKRSELSEYLDNYELWRNKKLRNRCLKIYANRILSGSGTDSYTGVVITGYGSSEFMPSYKAFLIHGLYPNGLCYTHNSEVKIDTKTRSLIETFAQDDVMQTFINGIDPYLLERIQEGLLKTIDDMTNLFSEYMPEGVDMDEIHDANKEIVQSFLVDVHHTMQYEYRFPVEDAVEFLSKDEMATLAESLIQSTSLRRHVSRDMESVGGPIDVAVISRNEGFVWIRRKHYFNTDLNLSYLARRKSA